MADRLFLHVGTPNSGTTFVQSVLWQNADALREVGFLLPGKARLHYAAAKSVTSRRAFKSETPTKATSAWPRLIEQVNDWPGTAAISHELFAPASREQARGALAEVDGAEIHLVVTVGSLYRQLTASWQEQVKGGMALPLREFLRRVEHREARGTWFWDVQDVAGIAKRWGTELPPDRVHVVTIPAEPSASDLGLPAGSEPLWQRFAHVLGLDAASTDCASTPPSPSLGAVEAELLRRVHAVGDARFGDAARNRWTRKLLATNVLGRRGGDTIALPDDTLRWVADEARTMIRDIEDCGYQVGGDLADLAWAPRAAPDRLISDITDAELDAVSAWTIGHLQVELVERQSPHPPPPVGPDDGVDGILKLLEHIRAADSETSPREREYRRVTTSDRIRKSITALRGR